ncbi:MAG: OmpA family protein [Formivibrio sp.]|nr:OmpA family protein [Formivibrio sp.]
MDEGNTDHLSSSLTDLMTSLMVIFILLLLVFVSHTASKDAVLTDVLLTKLRKDLQPQGFNENTIRPDPRDKNAILVIVPGKLMNFRIQKADLKDDGKDFLKGYIPNFAHILCDNDYRASIESIVVEGHTDRTSWAGRTPEQSQDSNLKLSQDRSMAVVEESLADLEGAGKEQDRSCFLEKLSATGRGEQEPEKTDDESRRVIFRIRIKARYEDKMVRRLGQ